MKKKVIIILLLVIVLLGGGIIVWKLSQNKKKTSSSNQQKNNNPTPTPLNKLSDQELEKCLLEDFSRRLDLEKYFVFNLGELTKEVLKLRGYDKTWNNGRITKPTLSKDLTEITKLYKSTWKKKGILFVNENYTQTVDGWRGEELDKKIDDGKDWYIIFENNSETEKKYFYDGRHANFVFVAITPVDKHVFESKEKALEFLKNNDPALSEKN